MALVWELVGIQSGLEDVSAEWLRFSASKSQTSVFGPLVPVLKSLILIIEFSDVLKMYYFKLNVRFKQV